MNQSLQISGCQEVAMISNVYPVPIPVTRAKVELVIDQTAKATAETIATDEQAVLEANAQASAQASEQLMVDLTA
jgi:hypothetical protein